MHVRAIIILVAMFSGSLVEHVAAQSQFFVAPLVAGPLDANLRDTESAFVLNHDGIRRRDNVRQCARRPPVFFNEPRNSLNFRIHQGKTGFGTDWRVDVAAHDIGFLSFPYLVTAGYLPGPGSGTYIAHIRKIGTADDSV